MENEQLLLVDLLARLPYGVKIKLGDYDYHVCGYNSEKEMPMKIWYYYDSNLILKSYIDVYLTDYRPYLRPMSSMTDVEMAELNCLCYHNIDVQDGVLCGRICADEMSDVIEFLNKNMFDYRGLIPKGLALEAPEDMYKD